MVKSRPKDATLTPADLEAGKRLRAIWDQKAKGLGLTQEKAGDILGISQGGVGHYLNGRAALGVAATLQFAKLLGEPPYAIRSDLPGLDVAVSQPAGLDLEKVLAAQKLVRRLVAMKVVPAGREEHVPSLTIAYKIIDADSRAANRAEPVDLLERLAAELLRAENGDGDKRREAGRVGEADGGADGKRARKK